MCNLYRMTKTTAEVAQLFELEAAPSLNTPTEIYPGYPGLVVANGALRSMVWGFPLAQTSKKTGKPLKPKPVNNARTDKLDSYFWRYSFEERRCLIPLTAWAEAEGRRGSMTRTWLSLPDREAFAVAGIWTDSDQWGASYSMVMTDAVGDAASVHVRMPVILSRENEEAWVAGSAHEARALCRPWQDELSINRTAEPWTKRG